MKKSIKRKFSLNKILFYGCYTLFLVSTMLRSVLFLNDAMILMSQVCLILLSLASLVNVMHMGKKKMLILFLITALVASTKVISGSNTPLFMWLLILSARNIKFDNIVKYDLLIKIPLVILVAGFYFSGLTEVNIHIRDGVVRHSMGFTNPNVFSTYIMSIVAEFLYIRRNKLNILDLIGVILSIFIINYYAGSRTQIVCIVLLAVLLYLNKIFGGKKTFIGIPTIAKKITTFLIDHSFSIFFLISLLAVSLFSSYGNNNLLNELNDDISGRITAASTMMEKYEVLPFGQKVEVYTSSNSTLNNNRNQSLDNVYIYILLTFGVVTLLMYGYFMKKYMQWTRAEQSVLRYIMLVYMAGGMAEHFLIEPQLNVFLLYFAVMLFGSLERRKQ